VEFLLHGGDKGLLAFLRTGTLAWMPRMMLSRLKGTCVPSRLTTVSRAVCSMRS
jgi:hypothetical protein